MNNASPDSQMRDQTHAQRVAWYQQQIEKYDQSIQADSRTWKSISMVRGLTFLASVCLLVLGFLSYAGQQSLWFLLAGIVFAGFLYIAFRHEGIETRRNRNLVLLHL